jgi:hypothetical protein
VLIKRSQGRPLDIGLSSHSYAADLGATDANADEFSYQDAERALDIIFDHALRWQSAHLNLLSANVELGLGVNFWSRLEPLAVPLLQRLWFYSSDCNWHGEYLLQGGAPRLNFIKVEGSVKPCLFPAAELRVAEIVSMDGIHPCRLPYGILAQVAKSLSLVTLSVPAVVYSYTPSVCIATLQTLKISGPLLGEVPGDPSN